jgi:hypothetical protein
MKKRGLSGAISTLLLILLALVVVGIIWVVINNIISGGSENVGIGQFTIDLEVKHVKVQDNGVYVTVKRNPGKGEVKEIKFFLSDGDSTQSFEQETNIKELGEQTFILDYNEVLTEVVMAPKMQGQESFSDLIWEYDAPGSETVKSIPNLVSYWKFEGDANDEWGENHGTVVGASLVNGKFGEAYEFDDVGERVEVSDDVSLQIEDKNMSILAWISPYNTGVRTILEKKLPFSPNAGYGIYTETSNKVVIFIANQVCLLDSESLLENKWVQIAITQNYSEGASLSSTKKIYKNGVFFRECFASTVMGPDSSGENLLIGHATTFGSMNGIIDELMIFNRTLSDEEIEFIYNLDLS